MNKAVFAGSFDPFTNGHLSIVKRCARMFDEVTIIIGNNSTKDRTFHDEYMKDAIDELLREENLNNCNVIIYNGMIALYCKDHGIDYTVRGIRNNMDFNYEDVITKVNKILNPSLETVYLPSDDDALSSSMIREFIHHNIDVHEFVPYSINRLIESGMY